MSTTGCWTCKIRRKRCDKDTENVGVSYHTCLRLDLQCLGFGRLNRPEWMDNKITLATYKAEVKQATRGRKHSTPRRFGAVRPNKVSSTLVPLDSLSGSEDSHPENPHPHDYQPHTPHTTTRQSAREYWSVAYRYYYHGAVELQMSAIVDAIMERAPLSPLAILVVAFPQLHTLAMFHNPNRQWTPSDSDYTRLCHRIVSGFIPGKSRITDDHVVAAQYLLGFSTMTMAAEPAQMAALEHTRAFTTFSSLVPGQSARERGPVTQRVLRNMKLLAILRNGIDASDDTAMTECMDAMYDAPRAHLESVCALSRWKMEHQEREESSSFSTEAFMQRGLSIRKEIHSYGLHAALNTDVLLSEAQKCEDVQIAGALLYLHWVLVDSKPSESPPLSNIGLGGTPSASKPDVPEIGIGVDLVMFLLKQLPVRITTRHARALEFPLALAAAVNEKPEHMAWLDRFCLHDLASYEPWTHC